MFSKLEACRDLARRVEAVTADSCRGLLGSTRAIP